MQLAEEDIDRVLLNALLSAKSPLVELYEFAKPFYGSRAVLSWLTIEWINERLASEGFKTKADVVLKTARVAAKLRAEFALASAVAQLNLSDIETAVAAVAAISDS